MDRVAFVTEPLLSTEFVQYQVAAPLLERLARRFEVGLTAPALSEPVRQALESRGIHTFGGTAGFPPVRHPRDELPPYVWSWGRDALLGLNGREVNRCLREFGGLRVNYSMTTACDADCWYIQSGTLGPALEAMQRSFNGWLRWPARIAGTAIGAADWTHAWRAAKHARRIYSSTHHVGRGFTEHSIPVRGVLPFYYRDVFRPSAPSPSRGYLLSYLGKETDTQALYQLSQLGIPLKIFGSKSPGWVDAAFRSGLPAHVEILGHLSDEELRGLYSNALVTVFPFTEEPFGLVPVESMACGTPVLTYRRQGPGETVVDERTGWLVDTAEELVRMARRVFRRGYPAAMVRQCLERARDFHVDTLAQQWVGLISAAIEGSPEPEYVQRLTLHLAERPGSGPIKPRTLPHSMPIRVEPFGLDSEYELREPGLPALRRPDPLDRERPAFVSPGPALSGVAARYGGPRSQALDETTSP